MFSIQVIFMNSASLKVWKQIYIFVDRVMDLVDILASNPPSIGISVVSQTYLNYYKIIWILYMVTKIINISLMKWFIYFK